MVESESQSGVALSSRKRKRKFNRVSKGEGSLFLRGRVWWYKAPDGTSHSTKRRVKSEAVDWKQKFLAERSDGGGQPPMTTVRATVTVNEVLDDYIAYLTLKARKSVKIISQVLDANIRPVFGDRQPASLKTSDIEHYRSDREKSVDPVTVNRELAYFRAALNNGMIRQTPRKVDSVPYMPMADESHNVRTGFVEVSGYKRILQQLPVTLKPLFVCGYHVSTRKGELKNIVWPQVDFDESVIVLEPADTKTGKGRYLPIYGDMGEWLIRQKAVRDAEFPECPWVFFWHTADCVLGHGGVRTKPGSHVEKFDASWKAAVKRAGTEGLLFHDLRRSAQRNMRKAGIDQAIRMKISGHKTDSMERRYNIVDIEDVKGAAKQMAKWIKSEKAKKAKGKT
jgi:integrase